MVFRQLQYITFIVKIQVFFLLLSPDVSSVFLHDAKFPLFTVYQVKEKTFKIPVIFFVRFRPILYNSIKTKIQKKQQKKTQPVLNQLGLFYVH